MAPMSHFSKVISIIEMDEPVLLVIVTLEEFQLSILNLWIFFNSFKGNDNLAELVEIYTPVLPEEGKLEVS